MVIQLNPLGRRRLRVTPVRQLSAGVIRLQPLSRRQRRRRVRARLPLPLKVLTSLKTTAVLATALGVLVAPATAGRIVLGAGRRVTKFAIKRPITTFLGIPTAAGALAVSPTLQAAIDPRKRFGFGKKIGGAVEDPTTFLQKVAGFFRGAGRIAKETAPVVVPAAVIGAAIIGGRRLARRARGGPIPSAQLPIAALPTGIAPVSVRTTPLGAAQRVEKPPVEEKPPKGVPAVKITNKPVINIKISKSKRFINQQVNIKQRGLQTSHI